MPRASGACPVWDSLITFSVQDASGRAWFYQGKVGLGVEFQGSGTFHPLNDPTQIRNWGLLFVPNPGPGPGPVETLSLSIDRGCGSTYSLNAPIRVTFNVNEQQVMQALETLPRGVTIPQLVQHIYVDVDPGLHSVAAWSVEAHLLKLEREGIAERLEDNGWALNRPTA